MRATHAPQGERRWEKWLNSSNIRSEIKMDVYVIMRNDFDGIVFIERENAASQEQDQKNQGYNFEHNYWHRYKNLCSVMTMLMMLSFLIDQVQQMCCKVYQKARKHSGRLSALFERVRSYIHINVFDSWLSLYVYVGNPAARPPLSRR